jgi:hypothetical protein
MLIYLIKTWLNDKESLQLLLTSHHMHNAVQSFYKRNLRASEAQRALSPIASCRNSANLLPRLVGLGTEGELTFQKCQALRVLGMPEAEYRRNVLQLLKTHLSHLKETDGLCDISAGVTLGLGGTAITAANRDALLSFILGTYQTSRPIQMGNMMKGVCGAFLGIRHANGHVEAMVKKILGSYATGSQST